MSVIQRIAIIGPEASGKTELVKALDAMCRAEGIASIALEEYARRYFSRRALPADHTLSVAEMREVMRGQREAETVAVLGLEAGKGVVWVDASTLHGPLYAGMCRDGQGRLRFDLSQVDQEVMDSARNAAYDAFILCVPHEALGWQDDGMRAMPDIIDRRAFADACAAFLDEHYGSAPVIFVRKGSWAEREQEAMRFARRMLNRDSE